MTNRKLHMRFRSAPRSMTLDDLELLYVKIFSEFCCATSHFLGGLGLYTKAVARLPLRYLGILVLHRSHTLSAVKSGLKVNTVN